MPTAYRLQHDAFTLNAFNLKGDQAVLQTILL